MEPLTFNWPRAARLLNAGASFRAKRGTSANVDAWGAIALVSG
jgi:hypothetical protein